MIPRDHPSWQEMRDKLIRPRIETLKDELCSPMLDAEQTAAIRGQIAAFRFIIAEIEPNAPAGAGSRDYS